QAYKRTSVNKHTLIPCRHLYGHHNRPPMDLRVVSRANTRWKHWTAVWFAAMAALVHAHTASIDGGAEVTPAAASTSGAMISVADAFGVMSRLSWWGIDLAMEAAGYGACPFVEDPARAAREALERRIRAQPLVVEYLSTALSAWHSRQLSGRLEPLVVALTGSTGTGKTETAWVLAEGLLAKRCRISGGTTDIPRGLLVLNGGDYMMPARVDDYHKKIRRKVGQRLQFCGGNVVVLFDELQKAAPGTLDGESQLLRLCNTWRCMQRMHCWPVARANSRWFRFEQCFALRSVRRSDRLFCADGR
ncbi:unnamed protein product, partial [Laminaria digitata]